MEHFEGIVASESFLTDHGCSDCCRLGHDTRHFNVGQYRRVQKGTDEVQDASFFDPGNEVKQKDPSTTSPSLCIKLPGGFVLQQAHVDIIALCRLGSKRGIKH